ncbi:MAG: type II toxin-antitoxin system YafQ family toxin [Gammaproteobacteria bacterium]|nr:type II toxin-antitoxin system YafQ family toxin [Gammaproteobacteria bacterium]
MRQPSYSGQFRRDLKRIKKRGKDITKLKVSMQLLIEARPLPEQYLDHPLKGDWKNCRDLHIEPDWLLIYRIKDESVHFERTGTHSDLFD